MFLHLDAYWRSLLPWQRKALLGAVAFTCVAIVGGINVWRVSRPLTAAEAERFAQWVALTAEPAVASAFAERQRDGVVTIAEAQEVVEIAKAYPPGPGLSGP